MAEPGELEPWYNRREKRWEQREVLPEVCRNGHPLRYPNVHLTWRGCLCRRDRGGHRVVICETCRDEQEVPSCLAVS